jgi:1,2-diacylglycerol 3-alpha-glucosyltransferase
MKSLRICLIGARFPILSKAADEGFLWPVARGLAQRGHEVTIIAWQNPKRLPFFGSDNVEAFFLGEGPRAKRKDFPDRAYRQFLELHRKKPFDIVHSLDESGRLIAKNRKSLGVVVSYDVGATQMSQLVAISAMAQDTVGSLLRSGVAIFYKYVTTFWGNDRELLRTADSVFVTTPHQAKILEQYYLYPEYRTFVVPYGMEYVDISPRPRLAELSQKLGLPTAGKSIVTVSDMSDLNEHLGLLRAFQKLVVKKPSVRLIIVGNGPVWRELRYEILNLALGSKVICTGAVPSEDLPDYINLADIYVNLSSRTSGFEPAMLEAMALEKVVIGSELSPVATVIEDKVNGFLIRPADEQALFNLLMDMATDQMSTADIGARARVKVMDLLDGEKMVGHLLDGYFRTLERTERRKKALEGPGKIPTISTG